MEKFKNIFNSYIDKKTDSDIQIIDKINEELYLAGIIIDIKKWFYSDLLKKHSSDYSGTDILDTLLSHFVFFIDTEFKKTLYNYIIPDKINIHNEPYLSLNFDLEYYTNSGFYLNKKNKKRLKKSVKILTLDQKKDLMTNKLFFYMINQTKLKIYSKKEIRKLKLIALNEFTKTLK